MPKKTPTKPTTGRPITWTTALTRFFAHLVEHEKSDHTQKNYREDLLAFTAWYQTTFQERPDLRALAPAELREWKAHLRDDRQLEPRTVNRKLAALRSFLTWATDAGLAQEIATPKSLRQVPPPPRWLDRKQQRGPDPRRRALRRRAGRMPGPAPAQHRHPRRGGHRPALGRHPGPRALGHADRPQGQGTQAAVDPLERRGPRRPDRAPGHRAEAGPRGPAWPARAH